MIYITLDTCVWLGLLSVELNNEDNYFEEICFWIENKSITHIAPTNILEEWNRNKTLGKEHAVKHLRENEHKLFNFFKNDSTYSKIYNPDKISETIQSRIDRIDLILNTSEKANIDDSILVEAGKRNLLKSPPNHIKEGYKDTVNILTLIKHLKLKKYQTCFFSTIDGDFGIAANQKYELHNSLEILFKEVNLKYVYFGNKKNIDDERNSLGSIFFSELRKDVYNLPKFQDYLQEKARKNNEKELSLKKENHKHPVLSPDSDYLENIIYIDIILAKKTHSTIDKEIIKMLINRHDSYKQYFFNNIGDNGLV